MSDAELKLRCLELAMQQAKCEAVHSDRKSVVEIATAFYNHINPEPGAANIAQAAKGKGKSVDKSAPIFERPCGTDT